MIAYMVALNRQVATTKAYSLVPNTVKLPSPEIFSTEYDGEAVYSFINSCKAYFKLPSVFDTNI